MPNTYVNKVELADGTSLIDISDTTAVAADVASGKYFYTASGEKVQGTATGGGTPAISVVDTQDSAGGVVRTITALDISDTTATASDVVSGKYFYTADGTKTQGNVTSNTSSDLSASGDTVTVPAGLYATQATKSVAAGTAGTPSASKGTVSNHSVSVTPSVTNSAGYISGGTKTGSAVTVTASELASGNKEITSNGTNIDVVGYSTVSVNVSSGSSKAKYIYNGLASRTANSYGATSAKVTVTKAGTYNISFVAIRGSSSGTMGTNLYIGNTGKGQNTTWNNGSYGQYVSYTNQSISANQDVTIYATSGNASRTIYVGQLIVEEV